MKTRHVSDTIPGTQRRYDPRGELARGLQSPKLLVDAGMPTSPWAVLGRSYDIVSFPAVC